VHTTGLLVDTSIITKDSDPVPKSADYTNANPLETNNLLLSGTSVCGFFCLSEDSKFVCCFKVTYGSAIGIVVRVGEHTLLGKMTNTTESKYHEN